MSTRAHTGDHHAAGALVRANHRPWFARLVAPMLMALAVVGAACSTSAAGNAGNGSIASTPANRAFTDAGPYATGTRRVTLADGDQAQLWYPVDRSAVVGRATYSITPASWIPPSEADEPALAPLDVTVPTGAYLDAPIATGPSSDPAGYPVVVFASSSGGTPDESSFLTGHLATWGMVVVAPDLRTNDLQSELVPPTPVATAPSAASTLSASTMELDTALAYLQASESDRTSTFHNRLDLHRVGVVGFGSGGGAAVTMASLNPSVRTYVALAPTAANTATITKPGLVMYGSNDLVNLPATVQQLWAGLATPKRLIVIADAGYNVFDDYCQVIVGGQRLGSELSTDSGNQQLRSLGTKDLDGCASPDLSPLAARPLIQHAVTAQLRYGLGIDATPVGLDAGLDHAYLGVSVSYYEK